ncbi:Retrovirus-related Pol polyprotein from transposon TNT 1-94 [Araneus ventricosus]|uniref:Retrovirus-related Pol polyprotein from transposon TNT 1-94 n=1 Tax=Araneus ventricosus TaxID=182803 RepID=A0A4Y2DMR5_ARAVE|nr:Retrovirus-related Pol polyprotein from transposon TNT 1-94 [Araneus ventricosus]
MSQRQSCIVLSTTEAEFIASSQAAKEAIWLGNLLSELRCVPTIRILQMDNQSAIRLVKNPEFHSRTKHRDIGYKFIHEQYQTKQLDVVYCSSEMQAADIFTKPLVKGSFRFLCRIVVAFILLQIPLNASIRLQPMDPGLLCAAEMKSIPVISPKSMEPSPSPAAVEALKNVKILLKNKPYSALRDLVNSAIEFVVDPSHALSESRNLLKEYALHVFPKQYYLYALG